MASMDALGKVEAAAAKEVRATDGQRDWQAFRKAAADQQGFKGRREGVFAPTRHAPEFPARKGDRGKGDRGEVNSKDDGDDAKKRQGSDASASDQDPDDEGVPAADAQAKGPAAAAGEQQQQQQQQQQTWTELVEPETKRTYWFNNATGETVYENPAGGKRSDPKPETKAKDEEAKSQHKMNQGRKRAPSGAAAQVKRRRTSTDARNPYEQAQSALARHQAMQHAASQARAAATAAAAAPSTAAAAPGAGAATAAAVAPVAPVDAARLWTRVLDPTTRRTYWFHKQTRETTWTRPTSLGPERKNYWLRSRDPDTGKLTWYNRQTGEPRRTGPLAG